VRYTLHTSPSPHTRAGAFSGTQLPNCSPSPTSFRLSPNSVRCAMLILTVPSVNTLVDATACAEASSGSAH
jgi:hypothetical protein